MDCSDMYTDKDNTIDPDQAAKCSATRIRKFCQIEPKFMNPEIQELSELSVGDEWENCKKPQGHGGFLPWKKFLKNSKSHLCKAGIKDDVTTADYIETSGTLVVRLVVGFVSVKRPEELYKSLSKHRGTKHIFMGSGAVIHMEPSTDKCRCCKCTQRTGNVKTWGIYISTATHVVFDHTESVWTTAELFYDSENRTSIKRVCTFCVEERSIIGDTCILKGVTCDEKLSQDLTELLTKQKQLYAALTPCESPTAFIISHPHGMHKYISWGPCQVADKVPDQIFWMTSYKYKTSTCPGSSGAPVFILHTHNKERHIYVIVGNFPVHSGSNSEGNYCGEHHEPTLMKVADVEKIRRKCKKQNTQCTNSNSTGNSCEADLHKHCPDCEKNPGHINFVPINDFNLDYLPSRYRDVLVFDFIKTFACLSCLVKVKYTSVERPKSVTGFSGQYPYYNPIGSDFLRTGTCTLVGVEKQDHDTCHCGKCQHSETPSKVWYIIRVKCAAHVIFDDSEVRQTRIVVGFDDDKSPGVSLDGWRFICSDVEGDWSFFECVTCDVELGAELFSLLNRLYVLEKEIMVKYAQDEDVDNLTILISHPHGCPKQVSVGQWTVKHVKVPSYDHVSYQLTYTTCTCPGSSGAAVYVFGQKFPKVIRRFITTPVHSDNLENGWNKSGYVVEDYVTEHTHADTSLMNSSLLVQETTSPCSESS